jgi:hypothetical protein
MSHVNARSRPAGRRCLLLTWLRASRVANLICGACCCRPQVSMLTAMGFEVDAAEAALTATGRGGYGGGGATGCNGEGGGAGTGGCWTRGCRTGGGGATGRGSYWEGGGLQGGGPYGAGGLRTLWGGGGGLGCSRQHHHRHDLCVRAAARKAYASDGMLGHRLPPVQLP